MANIATTSTSGTVTALMSDVVNYNWIVDTDASNHMVYNLSMMNQHKDLRDQGTLKVNLPIGGQVPIGHVGSLQWKGPGDSKDNQEPTDATDGSSSDTRPIGRPVVGQSDSSNYQVFCNFQRSDIQDSQSWLEVVGEILSFGPLEVPCAMLRLGFFWVMTNLVFRAQGLERRNSNENVEQEAPQVSADPLADQVTNAEFRASFQVFAQAMTNQSNKKVVVPVNPNVVCEKSFQELKDRLTSTLVLTLPKGSDGFVVYCDASKIGLGCVLMQNGKVIDYVLRCANDDMVDSKADHDRCLAVLTQSGKLAGGDVKVTDKAMTSREDEDAIDVEGSDQAPNTPKEVEESPRKSTTEELQIPKEGLLLFQSW
ncbi:hypothetical protein MTR67_012607 [Solanum verrucosum]|uniref:Reverse transcriptase/retrotransposon-derived protein RNase H-like domain-containing protein n=1 Tax=Solanum verrucosum TaxID=315347 RepID=A0AAF0TG51_SOLVR|nr:hypothetical protein MTR67_012607 [Solanum verrucosum]